MHDLIHFLGRRPAESGDMLFGDHRIVQVVRLVVILDDGPRQGRAFFKAEPLGNRSRGNVSDNDLDGDDFHLPDQLFAHVQPAHEMRRNADRAQPGHQKFGYPVIEYALAGYDAFFLVVKGGRVVLEILDQSTRLGTLKNDFRLALVDTSAAGHTLPRLSGDISTLECALAVQI